MLDNLLGNQGLEAKLSANPQHTGESSLHPISALSIPTAKRCRSPDDSQPVSCEKPLNSGQVSWPIPLINSHPPAPQMNLDTEVTLKYRPTQGQSWRCCNAMLLPRDVNLSSFYQYKSLWLTLWGPISLSIDQIRQNRGRFCLFVFGICKCNTG